MKRLNIRIVRYVDDILLFARKYQEAKQYQQIVISFPEKNLKLVVDKEKTHLTNHRKGVVYITRWIQEE